jgi:hypothetical protein
LSEPTFIRTLNLFWSLDLDEPYEGSLVLVLLLAVVLSHFSFLTESPEKGATEPLLWETDGTATAVGF